MLDDLMCCTMLIIYKSSSKEETSTPSIAIEPGLQRHGEGVLRFPGQCTNDLAGNDEGRLTSCEAEWLNEMEVNLYPTQ